ncbi:PAP2_Aur1_like domain containing protein [Acidimicrobiia bacterium]
MTDAHATTGSAPAPRWRSGRRLSDGSRLFWWKEIIIVLVVNGVYESIRNFTSSTPAKAYANALRIIDWQKTLGIWHEYGIQQWALNSTAAIIVANYFYGSVYLGATIAGLVYLFRVHPDDYPLWRNTLVIGTMLGLIGFATFPLMPPRLLDTVADGIGNGNVFGFVDTLVKYPTFWSFDSEAMKTISNQFAAMPSLHCGWAFWGFAVFYSRVRSNWARALAALYPIATITVVVVTANHFFLDAVGGLAIFVAGYWIARAFTRSGRGVPKATSDDAVTDELNSLEAS